MTTGTIGLSSGPVVTREIASTTSCPLVKMSCGGYHDKELTPVGTGVSLSAHLSNSVLLGVTDTAVLIRTNHRIPVAGTRESNDRWKEKLA